MYFWRYKASGRSLYVAIVANCKQLDPWLIKLRLMGCKQYTSIHALALYFNEFYLVVFRVQHNSYPLSSTPSFSPCSACLCMRLSDGLDFLEVGGQSVTTGCLLMTIDNSRQSKWRHPAGWKVSQTNRGERDRGWCRQQGKTRQLL